MHKHLVIAFLALLTAGANAAQSIDIVILKAQYSTDLSISTGESQITKSGSPIDNKIQYGSTVCCELQGARAEARADTFSVSSATDARGDPSPLAIATAESKLTFNTLKDESALLVFHTVLSGVYMYTTGFLSLYDLTSQESVLANGWTFGTGAAPGMASMRWGLDGTTDVRESILTMQTQLLASHLYELTLHESTYANFDGQGAVMNVAGFQPIAAPVPEPETWAMLVLGLAIVGWVQKRNQRPARP